MIALSEVAQPILRTIPVLPGTKYRTIGVKWWGEGAYERETIDGMQTAAKTLTLIKENDLIINKIWVRNGSTAVASEKVDGCAASGEFPTFELNQTKILPRWLHWITKTQDFWQKCDILSRGTSGKNRIRPELFLTIEIPLPPLEEQRRIVARIEELAAKIEEARGLRRNQQQETEFLLESILKYTCINQMQGLACKKKLGDITTITSGGTPSRAMASYWDGDIPWIKTGELLDGDIYQSEEYLSKEGLENSSAKLFPPGTILIALYGQGQTRGRTGRLMVEASTNQACCAILPNPSLLNEKFTQYWLRGIYTHMRETAHGGAQPNWNSQTIKSIVIALPSLAEQESTISYFDSIEKQINFLKHKQSEVTAELDALLPSILDKAFKGEL